MITFPIKQGDTSPAIEYQLIDGDGNAVDLTNASVDFHMAASDGTLVVDAAATIVDASTGTVEYAWASGDTDTTGVFLAEFEATYSDGTVETFPNSEHIAVEIHAEVA